MIVKGLEIPSWENIKREWRDADALLLIFPILLMILGGVAIYSSDFRSQNAVWWQHWVTGSVGLVAMFAIARFHYDQLLRLHWITYAITNISLEQNVGLRLVGLIFNLQNLPRSVLLFP